MIRTFTNAPSCKRGISTVIVSLGLLATFGCSGNLTQEGAPPSDGEGVPANEDTDTDTPKLDNTLGDDDGANVGDDDDTGSSDDTAGGTSGSDEQSPVEDPVVSKPADPIVTCELGELVAARVRRLTRGEYERTVESLLPGSSDVPVAFPEDPSANGYRNKADLLRVTQNLAQALWLDTPAIADFAAEQLVSDNACASQPNAGQDCARTILAEFAGRAYRRPIEEEALGELLDVFETGRTDATFTDGINLALRVVFQSAEFLYRTELGQEGATGPVTLEPSEIAQELAYFVLGGPPDAALAAKAAGDALLDADEREAELRRLLELPGARMGLGDFAAQWLDLTDLDSTARDTGLYPEWKDVRGLALGEARDFFAEAVLNEEADFRQLLTADWSMGSGLADFYGATATGERLALPPERRGILTQSAFLASNSQASVGSPIRRGHFVRVRMLCGTIPDPPPNLVITLPEPDATSTARQKFEEHSSNETCAGCHSLMDPIGYAFSNFDAIGRYATMDNGQTIDATGELVGTDVDGDLDGATELATRLADSELARTCFAAHWLEFAAATSLARESRCGVDAFGAEFVDDKASVRDLMISLVRSDLFTSRAPQFN